MPPGPVWCGGNFESFNISVRSMEYNYPSAIKRDKMWSLKYTAAVDTKNPPCLLLYIISGLTVDRKLKAQMEIFIDLQFSKAMYLLATCEHIYHALPVPV
jgi:hypothetical protein